MAILDSESIKGGKYRAEKDFLLAPTETRRSRAHQSRRRTHSAREKGVNREVCAPILHPSPYTFYKVEKQEKNLFRIVMSKVHPFQLIGLNQNPPAEKSLKAS